MVKATLKAAALCMMSPVAAVAADSGWAKVADALGKSATEMKGWVYRVGLPRAGLHVKLDGVDIKPTLALGSWLAFQGNGDMTMVWANNDAAKLVKGLRGALDKVNVARN